MKYNNNWNHVALAESAKLTDAWEFLKGKKVAAILSKHKLL